MPTRVAARIRAPPHKRGANIIARGFADPQTGCFANDESHGLRLELADVA